MDGVGGPLPRLNAWPVDPAVIDALLADPAQPLDFRTLARLNRIEPPVNVTSGLHVIEYLLWGVDGAITPDAFASDGRRAAYLAAVAQLFVNDLTVLVAAWAPGVNNNYRAAVEAMDQRNALGRAFNGMAVLVAMKCRCAGSVRAFSANETSSLALQPHLCCRQCRQLRARAVYFDTGLDGLVREVDPDLAAKIMPVSIGLLRRLLRWMRPTSGSLRPRPEVLNARPRMPPSAH